MFVDWVLGPCCRFALFGAGLSRALTGGPPQEVEHEEDAAAVAKAVLAAECGERERQWTSCEAQRTEVAGELADLIFEDLTDELVSMLVALDAQG